MAEAARLDKRAVRRAFGRAACDYDRHAVLQREVGARLLEHLDPIRMEPSRIVDLGCGTGEAFEGLRKRYPGASLVAIDMALPMLEGARARTPWWRRTLTRSAPLLACADAERLPLAAACAELAFSNLMLHWCDAPVVFAEAARMLRTGGLFLFSTLGPDTLKELRAAFAESGHGEHVHGFVDMHDLGDALVGAGFADPVMEMETLTLEYSSVEALAADLRGAGAGNAHPQRARGLGGRQRWRSMAERYELRRRGAILPATFEVVYGHAWKAKPRAIADGRAIVDFHPRAAR